MIPVNARKSSVLSVQKCISSMRGSDTGDSSGDLVYPDFSLSFRSQFARRPPDRICRLVGRSEDYHLHCHKQPLVSPKPRGSLCVEGGCEILSTFYLRVVRSFVQLAPCNKALHDCTTLITHQLTDHSQLKHLFACLWCVLYCHPTCVTVSKHMAGRDIIIRYLKLS